MRPGVLYPDDVVLFVNPVLDPIAVVNVVLEEALQFAPELLDLAGHSPFRSGLKKPQRLGCSLGITGADVPPTFPGFLPQAHLVLRRHWGLS